MSRTTRTAFVFGISLGGLGLTLTLATLAAQTVFQQKPLTEFLNEHNWVALSIPDSKMRPGSVIKVAKKNNFVEVQWLGDIRKCGISDKELGLVRGKYPSIGIGESFAVKASIAASILNLFRVNADADKVSGAILKIDDAGGDAIDLVAFSIWVSKQGKRLQATCSTFLAQEDVFLVSEAFRVSKGSYKLVDKNGVKIELSGSVAGRAADAQLQASIGGNEGELDVAGDFFFGVRRVKQLSPGSFETLGDPQKVLEADGLLLEAQ